MRPDGGIVLAGVDHRSVSTDRLEAVRRAVAESSPAAALALGATGAVGVVTCHRAELYLEGIAPGAAPGLFEAWCSGALPPVEPLVRSGAAAVRHLLRVAAGLEAAVLGDDQVLSQLRGAYAAACRGLHGGTALHRAFHAAFRAGKRVRSETALGQGGRSVAGEAVALAVRRLRSLGDGTVLVLGAGEMARIAATRLARRGPWRILVANRTPERARALAASVGGEAVPWSWRERAALGADVLVAATAAAEPVLSLEALTRAAAWGRGLLGLDLSMPRNLPVPVAPVPGLELVDLAALAGILADDARRRRAAVERAEAIVEEELGAYLAWAASRTAGIRAGGREGRAVG